MSVYIIDKCERFVSQEPDAGSRKSGFCEGRTTARGASTRPTGDVIKQSEKIKPDVGEKITSYVLDVDIKGFFQHLDHEWIIRFIESRSRRSNFCG